MSYRDWTRDIETRAAMVAYVEAEPIHGPAVARFPLGREDLNWLRAIDKAFANQAAA